MTSPVPSALCAAWLALSRQASKPPARSLLVSSARPRSPLSVRRAVSALAASAHADLVVAATH